MVILTTNDIVSFPIESEWFNSTEEVAKACREGALYGIKAKGYFQSWKIPADSLAYYLRYCPLFKASFNRIQLEGLDPEMTGKIKAVKHYLDLKDVPHNESYSITVLSSVFGVPINQIVVMFCASEPIWKRMLYSLPGYSQSYSHGVSISKIIKYLDKNSNWVDKLYERQQMFLANGNIADEAITRHILMLFSYYKKNGYLL